MVMSKSSALRGPKQQRQVSTHRGTRLLLGLGLFGACLFVSALVTQTVNLPGPLNLPPAALVAFVALFAATPFMLAHWRFSFWTMIAWVMVEDYIRKRAGNNLAVYFMKDVFYGILIVGVVISGEAAGMWRRAVGRGRVSLYALGVWAIVLCVPAAFVNIGIALTGLRAYFFYVPFVAIGYVMVRTIDDLRRLLIGLGAILAPTTLIGVIQSNIGPSFLAPTVSTPGLINLDTVRGAALGLKVYRPTGTFVDPGRYASVATLCLVVGLAGFALTKGWTRVAMLAGVGGIGIAGVWVSGGRAPLLIAIVLVLIAFLTPRAQAGGKSFVQSAAVGSAVALAGAVLMLVIPSIFSSRLSWYQQTLDPRLPGNEWAVRWQEYTGNIWKGIDGGGVFGTGTGMESIGKLYVLRSGTSDNKGLFITESGYGSVAVEWGAIGLILWLVWVVSWLGRQFGSARATRAGPARTVAVVLSSWVFIFLVIQFYAGIGVFQNYVANLFFWLFSGVIFGMPRLDPGRGHTAIPDVLPLPASVP